MPETKSKAAIMAETTSLRRFLHEADSELVLADDECILVAPDWLIDFPVVRCGDHVLVMIGPTVRQIRMTLASAIYERQYHDLSDVKGGRIDLLTTDLLRMFDVRDLSDADDLRMVCPDCGEVMQKTAATVGETTGMCWTCGCVRGEEGDPE